MKIAATLDQLRPRKSLIWVACSAEENHSSRSAKGNKYMRRILCQTAHAAARSKSTHFQSVFRRLLPRLGYRSAIWAIAHRLCRLVWKILHDGVHYIEQGDGSESQVLMNRAKYLARQLRRFGYDLQVTTTEPSPAYLEVIFDGVAGEWLATRFLCRRVIPRLAFVSPR